MLRAIVGLLMCLAGCSASPPGGGGPDPHPPVPCAGDCDGDGLVTRYEVLRVTLIARGDLPVTDCPAGDVNADGAITVDEVIRATMAGEYGCTGQPAPPTAVCTGLPTGTPTLVPPWRPTPTKKPVGQALWRSGS